MENQEKNAVVCSNCCCTRMELIENPFTTMDRLEWSSFITTTLTGCFLLIQILRKLAPFFSPLIDAPAPVTCALLALPVLLIAGLSYSVVTNLSLECRRMDGICVWNVRCAKCHTKYRIVRSLGTVPPWETDEEILDADFEADAQEETHAADA